MLSSSLTAEICLDSLHDGIDFYSAITRARFEELNIDLFLSTLEPVERALDGAKMNKSQINEILLVGGSTRIPSMQKLLQDFFDGKNLTKSINPDEAAAYGAAVEAAIIKRIKSPNIKNLVLIDVISHSLVSKIQQAFSGMFSFEKGVEVNDGVMQRVMKRHTIIPSTRTHLLTSCFDNQTYLSIKVYEGESSMTQNNHLLGELLLTGIPPTTRGTPQIEVKFNIDANGALEVSAKDKATGKKNAITITNTKKRLLECSEFSLAPNFVKREASGDIENESICAKDSLQFYCFNMKKTINDEVLTDRIGRHSSKKVMKAIEAILR